MDQRSKPKSSITSPINHVASQSSKNECTVTINITAEQTNQSWSLIIAILPASTVLLSTSGSIILTIPPPCTKRKMDCPISDENLAVEGCHHVVKRGGRGMGGRKSWWCWDWTWSRPVWKRVCGFMKGLGTSLASPGTPSCLGKKHFLGYFHVHELAVCAVKQTRKYVTGYIHQELL